MKSITCVLRKNCFFHTCCSVTQRVVSNIPWYHRCLHVLHPFVMTACLSQLVTVLGKGRLIIHFLHIQFPREFCASCSSHFKYFGVCQWILPLELVASVWLTNLPSADPVTFGLGSRQELTFFSVGQLQLPSQWPCWCYLYVLHMCILSILHLPHPSVLLRICTNTLEP